MRLKKRPTLVIAMISLGAKGARRHAGTAAIAMVAMMAQAVGVSAINSVCRSWTTDEYSWDSRKNVVRYALDSKPLRLGQSNEQQLGLVPMFMAILGALICVIVLSISMA